ncbi:penicillin-binding transpeptidase domain-containing protein [Embleya scabrispora]|uniref:penicillin-binding transpeptidase domain-containing protein n=1 Tax=Embleya scabrispora TaxID=159449 RepID=UPI0003788091|nr:penicillin-binding transpeptidase domain-containing protein [Embleya scabrispora]MYS82289.1 penicillin-binding protein [Streptomyces sp. SID5474]
MRDAEHDRNYQDDREYDDYGDDGHHEHEDRRRNGWVFLVLALLLIVGTGYGAYSFLLQDDPSSTTKANPTASGAAGAAEQSPRNAARRFLGEWQTGNWTGAGALTTDPNAAGAALVGLDDGLRVSSRRLTAGEAQPERPDGSVLVPFEARLTLKDAGEWTYTGTLTVARAPGRGYLVGWAPTALHPELTSTTRLKLMPNQGGAGGGDLHAKDGSALSPTEYPSLAALRTGLASKARPAEQAASGGTVLLVDAGTSATVRQVATVGEVQTAPPADGGVRTTLDAKLQAAAERAVGGESRTTSLAAVRIGTGEIVALANNPASGPNNAFLGTTPPGSTLKIVTAATLLTKGAVDLDDKVGCPESANAGGMRFTNSEGRAFPEGTFKLAFAQSCNTTMANLSGKLTGADLAGIAHDCFGIGGDWKTGIVSFDGRVPVATDDTMKAANMIGQGQVQMNPLTMASVVATAKSGTFRQPHLLVDQEGLWRAPRQLSPGVSSRLRTLMRSVVTEGTARDSLGGLGGDVGAKTGTAEVGGGKPNNGWMVAYRGDIAVAVWVEGGITGGRSAGPIVKSFLGAAG